MIASLILILLPYLPTISAAEVDLKPGDVIGPDNWQRVQGMVGENLLNRIKQGYTFKIKQGRAVGIPIEFTAATSRYSDQVKLGSNGELVNYVAGLPFPTQHQRSAGWPKVDLEFFWRWLGDDYKTGGGTGRVRYSLCDQKNGSERRADVIHHAIKTRGRVHLDTNLFSPGISTLTGCSFEPTNIPGIPRARQPWRYVTPTRKEKTISTFMFRVYAAFAALHQLKDAPP